MSRLGLGSKFETQSLGPRLSIEGGFLVVCVFVFLSADTCTSYYLKHVECYIYFFLFTTKNNMRFIDVSASNLYRD